MDDISPNCFVKAKTKGIWEKEGIKMKHVRVRGKSRDLGTKNKYMKKTQLRGKRKRKGESVKDYCIKVSLF